MASIAIPNLLQSIKRAKFTAMIAEAKSVQEALTMYSADDGQYPLEGIFGRQTLEPLVSEGYLKDNSFISYCRDDEIHDYKFDPNNDQPLEWHFHPKIKPYDDGPQKIRIVGNGSSLTLTYLGQTYTSSSIMPLIF